MKINPKRRRMATYIWINIGSGNGLLPDGTKPLPEPMLTYHQRGPVKASEHEMHQLSITRIGLKITDLRFHSEISQMPVSYQYICFHTHICFIILCVISDLWVNDISA